MTTQEAAMREFCRRIIKEYCWGYCSEPDGGDVQDLAEKFGLVVPDTATAEDVENGMEVDVGDTIYRLADWLQERT